jgi:hypothetical protein
VTATRSQPTFNLADLLEIVVDAVPDREALVAGAARRTFDAIRRTPSGKADHRWAKQQFETERAAGS